MNILRPEKQETAIAALVEGASIRSIERMTGIRRFTRLTNAFSKKLENLKAAVALHFAHYNFVRIHSSLRMTPAMQAGITERLWSIRDLMKAN